MSILEYKFNILNNGFLIHRSGFKNKTLEKNLMEEGFKEQLNMFIFPKLKKIFKPN